MFLNDLVAKLLLYNITVYNVVIDDGSCIRENSPTGTIVRRFTTTDGDTVSTNTDHVYEIEAGGINTAGDVSCTLATIDHK